MEDKAMTYRMTYSQFQAQRSQDFWKVVSFLRAQGLKSQNAIGCRYRDYSLGYETMCAAGCLMSDQSYNTSMEGSSVGCSRIGDTFGSKGHDVALLAKLQDIHDNCKISSWEGEWQSVASTFSLRMPDPLKEVEYDEADRVFGERYHVEVDGFEYPLLMTWEKPGKLVLERRVDLKPALEPRFGRVPIIETDEDTRVFRYGHERNVQLMGEDLANKVRAWYLIG